MNIKQFTAKDMRTALRDIRESLGPEAVMLSSRQLSSGVEVIAAIDYEEAAGSVNSAESHPATFAATSVAEGERHALVTQPSALAHGDPTAHVNSELRSLRRLLETQLAGLAWNDLNRHEPVRARMLRQYARLGIDLDLAHAFAQELAGDCTVQDAGAKVLGQLARKLPLCAPDAEREGSRVLAVVGPTGVGKTTSIAKLAARFVLQNRSHELGLISMDNYRIGAREQLLTFARILGVPMHVAETSDQLRHALDTMVSKKLVLIDTAGMSQRDLRLAEQFSALAVEGRDIETVLAVSAAAERGSLNETFKAFQTARPSALIVTKIDEATTLGPLFSVAIKSGLPIAYLSDGQRVPEDFHAAGSRGHWLLQTAVRLARVHAEAPDEDALAVEVGALELAANG